LSDEPPKEDRSLVLIAVVGLVASLIPTLVIMLLVRSCDDPVMERNYKYQREKITKLTSRPEEKIVAEPVEAVEVDQYMTLEQELLALAPGIYVSVRFLHESGIALMPDELNSEDRVDLLNDTFKFIKDRYPDMTKFLRLAYDDGRPSFDMKFGAEI